MVTPDRFHQLILGVLTPYTKIEYANRDAEIHNELIVDQDRGHYLVMSTGWARDPLKRRIHGSLIHLAVIDGKIWVPGTDFIRVYSDKKSSVYSYDPADDDALEPHRALDAQPGDVLVRVGHEGEDLPLPAPLDEDEGRSEGDDRRQEQEQAEPRVVPLCRHGSSSLLLRGQR